MKPEPEFFPIQSLTFDPELQIRVNINDETIALYAEQMATEEDMKAFPAVEIYYDGVKYWLADGHHRRAAAELAGHNKVWAVVQSGTRADALWAAILGNGKQGFGLTRADKQRAIVLAICQWPEKSNRVLAVAIGCSRDTVRRLRDSLSGGANAPPDLQPQETVVGKDGKSYPAKRNTKKDTSQPGTATEEGPTETQASEPASVSSVTAVPLFDDGAGPKEEKLEKTTTKTVTPAPESVTEDTAENDLYYPDPPYPNKGDKYFPKTTLKLISQESPHGLIANLFAHFRKGYVEELVIMAMDRIHEKLGKAAAQKVLRELNKRHGK